MNKKLLQLIAKLLGYSDRIPKETMEQSLSCLTFIPFLEFISITQTRFEDFMVALHIGGPNEKQKYKNTKQTKKQTKNKKPNKTTATAKA